MAKAAHTVQIVSADVASKPTTVRLDEGLRAELHAAAQARGISDAQLVRDAITWHLGWLARDEGYKPPRAEPKRKR